MLAHAESIEHLGILLLVAEERDLGTSQAAALLARWHSDDESGAETMVALPLTGWGIRRWAQLIAAVESTESPTMRHDGGARGWRGHRR